ncbi:MAG: Os1348 family NHLP clan protein [Chloroflexota bacterium]
MSGERFHPEDDVSLRALIDVTTKLMTDGDFRNLLVNQPDAALRDFTLTPDELEAVKRRDRWLLEECGLEEWTARWVSSLR